MPASYDPHRVRHAYDMVATAYAATFGDELERLPLDAELVDRVAAESDDPILELGAGVAPVARRLRSRHVVAADLSPGMLAHAPVTAGRVQADTRWLPFRRASFGAATIRYVLQHLARAELPDVLHEVRRVLRPGAWLLVAVHLGQGEVELSELLGARFDPIGGTFHTREEIVALLAAGGFQVVDDHERGHVGDEGPSRRLYVVARAVSLADASGGHSHTAPSPGGK